jgi:transposase
MLLITLSETEHEKLLQIVLSTQDARKFRRALVLLWLNDGEDVEEVAHRVFVTRQTVYRWIKRFDTYKGIDMETALSTGQRSGRPKTAQGIIDPLILDIIDTDPREFGYCSTVWTAPLLCQYLRDIHHIQVSRRSVGLALARLNIAWKRPRYDLSRRSPTWRQAKGGSSEAFPSVKEPSF